MIAIVLENDSSRFERNGDEKTIGGNSGGGSNGRVFLGAKRTRNSRET